MKRDSIDVLFPALLALFAPLALSAILPSPAAAQFGAVGLSAVRARQFPNAGLGDYPTHDGDRFAWALATGDFNGDGADDLATGAPGHDNFAGDFPASGVVFVHYSLPGLGLAGGSAGQAITQAGNPDPAESGDSYGQALAACDFNGDGRDDLAVGVPFEDLPGASDGGEVQIHLGSTVGLTSFSTQILTQDSGTVPGDSENFDYFGSAVACGHFDGDAFADLAIGAWDENLQDAGGNELFGAGAVVVLRGSAAGLRTDNALLLHQNVAGVEDVAESFDYFGWALAAGDFDGDGFDDLAVGIPGEDNIGDAIPHGRGAVQVIFGSAGGLQFSDDFFRSESALGGNSELGDRLGETLAAGDFDGDGFDDLAIGAPYEDLFPTLDAGQVVAIYGSASGFVFARTQFWSENAIYGEGQSESDDHFGLALAAGDFDHDGRDDLAIGHPGELVLVPSDGVVTVVMGAAAGLSSARWYRATAGFHGVPGALHQADRNFGAALAAGDFDGDGYADLAIGSPNEDAGGLADVGSEVALYGSLFSDGLEAQSTVLWSSSAP
jgi:hypothetical protein